MTRFTAVTAAAVGATAICGAMVGAGAASADPYAGHTYSDVSSALASNGQSGVVAGVVGSVLSRDDCLVTRSQNAPSNSTNTGSVLLYLNCNNTLASAGSPGYSAASPEGRATAAKNAAEAAQQEQQELAWRGTGEGQVWCAQAETQHPEMAPLAGCHKAEAAE